MGRIEGASSFAADDSVPPHRSETQVLFVDFMVEVDTATGELHEIVSQGDEVIVEISAAIGGKQTIDDMAAGQGPFAGQLTDLFDACRAGTELAVLYKDSHHLDDSPTVQPTSWVGGVLLSDGNGAIRSLDPMVEGDAPFGVDSVTAFLGS